MVEQGCVSTSYTDNDNNYTRLDWRWRALIKADWFVLIKTVDGLVLFVLKKTDLGCVYEEQSYDSNRRGHHCR